MIDFLSPLEVVRMSEKAFDSRSRTVGELLGSNQPTRIIVPTFQRGYSWEAKHVESFWKDISDPKRSKKYFLGPIVILNRDNDVIELLDGQQRLATATILFSVLRDVARGMAFKDPDLQDASDVAAYIQRDFIVGEDGARCLEMGETDDAFFRETIQDGKPSNRKPTIKSQRHIAEARKYLFNAVQTAIAPKTQPQQLEYIKNLKNTLRSDLVLACITVDSDGDAFQIFETLNDRGLRLSVPDLLLNYLMRFANEPDRKQLRKVWNEMLTTMGKKDISRFLRHLWVSKWGDLKDEGLFAALKRHIEDNSIGSLQFAQSCASECVNYVSIVSLNEEVLGSSIHDVRSLLQGLGAQSSLPMLLSSFDKFSMAQFKKIVRFLLVFVTRFSVLTRQESSDLEAILFEMARDVRSTPAAKKNAKVTEIKERLRKAAPTDAQITAAIDRMVLPSDSAEYVIRKLSDSMETKTKEKTTSKESNLEHIYPQNPEDTEWGGLDNQAEMEPYTWHIGNLTMLGERLNTKAKNAEFPVKRVKYLASELIMARAVGSGYTQWDKAAIEQRAKTLVESLVKIWNFDNPSKV
jgi:hypothetical protein